MWIDWLTGVVLDFKTKVYSFLICNNLCSAAVWSPHGLFLMLLAVILQITCKTLDLCFERCYRNKVYHNCVKLSWKRKLMDVSDSSGHISWSGLLCTLKNGPQCVVHTSTLSLRSYVIKCISGCANAPWLRSGVLQPRRSSPPVHSSALSWHRGAACMCTRSQSLPHDAPRLGSEITIFNTPTLDEHLDWGQGGGEERTQDRQESVHLPPAPPHSRGGGGDAGQHPSIQATDHLLFSRNFHFSSSYYHSYEKQPSPREAVILRTCIHLFCHFFHKRRHRLTSHLVLAATQGSGSEEE